MRERNIVEMRRSNHPKKWLVSQLVSIGDGAYAVTTLAGSYRPLTSSDDLDRPSSQMLQADACGHPVRVVERLLSAGDFRVREGMRSAMDDS